MENLDIQKITQRTYYLHSANDFARIEQIVNLMPNYGVSEMRQFEIVDYFYETPELLMNQLDASIRIRVMNNTQTLSIVCKNDGVRREFETEMELGDEIQSKNAYILFLEDKLQDMYTHKIDIDIARMLKNIKVFLCIMTNRTQMNIINNSGFAGIVNLDRVVFKTKRQNVKDSILEVKMNCLEDVGNKTAFKRFVTDIEQRVLITPMDETKFEAGKRIFNYEW